ncbi:isochorismatase family protein [Rubellimicrobium arenae]|uniref:isochorismatase family protein n=1 Tax=Rubellimicrobium arenae TaxID=2817372 RepID=UPI001B305FAF|nr:isochorismatase family protein [Rubellimicrobium arenae]
MRTAVLIVDMQRSLIEDETWEPERLVEQVLFLERQARSAGAPVIWIVDVRVGPHPELDARLVPVQGDGIVQKSDCDSFAGTELQALLRACGVDRVVVCGLQTDFCVDATCRAALRLGYDVVLAADAHSTFDRDTTSAAQVIEDQNRRLPLIAIDGRRAEVMPAQAVRLV